MRSFFLYLCLVITGVSRAQVQFRTLVPNEPVVSGESFQVQYILEDADRQAVIRPPVFDPFRLASGPNMYSGTVPGSNRPLRNAVYTLVTGAPGIYTVRGATVLINGQLLRSNDVSVQVISRQEAVRKQFADKGYNADYLLLPGENAQEKIRENLFVRVSVNKKDCYVGEPVQATFKLYSRLQSRSDIVKNPGFYGFTMYDVINLDDKLVEQEKVNGRLFDVHTIRKVQLYPLQAGVFTIDPMEIINKVEFSKSAVRKKTEQEIAEGMLGRDTDTGPEEGKTVVETTFSTEPVSISVKPVPEKLKPQGYNGATGRFSIHASVLKNELAKNEEGVLEVRISGKGNFVQLDAPVIRWPDGVEGFAPVIKDSLDKYKLPLQGSRTFRYSFVCTRPGAYTLPGVAFSFFDTDSNSFHTVSSPPVTVTGNDQVIKSTVPSGQHSSIAAKSEKKARYALYLVVAMVLVILLYMALRKNKAPAPRAEPVQPEGPVVQEYLAPASAYTESGGSLFYQELSRGAWNYLQQRLGLSGSAMNKHVLRQGLEKEGMEAETINEILAMLTLCETALFTGTDPAEDKPAFCQQLAAALEKLGPVR